MSLLTLLMDELDHVPPGAQPTEFLMAPAVMYALRREVQETYRTIRFETRPETRMWFCDVPVRVTDEVDFASVRFE